MSRRRALRMLGTTLASLAAALTIITVVRPDWVERWQRVDPDGGSGAVEWAVGLALLGLSCAVLLICLRLERQVASRGDASVEKQ